MTAPTTTVPKEDLKMRMRSAMAEEKRRFPPGGKKASHCAEEEPMGDQGTQTENIAPPSRDELSISDLELATANLTPTCFVEEYLYADVANLSAPGGTGKTTLVLYEAICIALERPVHGMKVMKPDWTLIITAEDQRERLVARLREIMNSMRLGDDERKVVMRSVLPWDVTGEQRKLIVAMDGNLVLTTLADDIVTAYEQDPPAQIVFDPLVSFGVSESMVNDNEQAIVTACRRIVKGLDSCVRLIAHTGKANAREKTLDQYSSRGGSALSDGARMVAVLQTWKAGDGMQPPAGCTPSEESSITILARPKLSYAKPNLPNLWIRRTGYNFETFTDIKISDEEREEATLDQVERFLESEVQHGHRHNKTSLERSSIPNLTRDQQRKAISILMAHGRIIEVDLPPEEMRTKRKTYLTTPAGFRRIQKNDDSNSAEKNPEINPAAYRENNGGIYFPPVFPPDSNSAAIAPQHSAGLAGLADTVEKSC